MVSLCNLHSPGARAARVLVSAARRNELVGRISFTEGREGNQGSDRQRNLLSALPGENLFGISSRADRSGETEHVASGNGAEGSTT